MWGKYCYTHTVHPIYSYLLNTVVDIVPATISFVQSSYNLVVVLGNRLLAEQVPVLQKRLSTPA
jgi:hypothetical protein